MHWLLPRFQHYFVGIRINRVIQLMTYSDILMLSGWGLISPIIAVFFTEQIIGGNIAVAGLAEMIFALVKSVFQVPIARYIDLKKGEKDDFYAMVIGSLLISVVAFLYFFARMPWHVYLIQVLYGLGAAFAYPGWYAIFTRHIDSREEGLEWSFHNTAVDLGIGLTAGLGGFLAITFGYQIIFILVGTLSLIGTIFLLGVYGEIKHRHKK